MPPLRTCLTNSRNTLAGWPEPKTQITQSCQKLETAVKKVQAQEETRKRGSVKPEPIYWFGKCKTRSYKL
ncbi:hypothetical protein G3M48_001901 [Beauveria asiatica]|uniref:Uncharacterized protein n=1 Tax=Beauveria asiatica TaxID=1069075 RepID=A0AAW0S735_9HYPO